MALTWFAAAAMSVAFGAPATEATVTALPAAAPAPSWTPISLTDEPARWRTQVCAGVTGLGGENAQYVVDRISGRAEELGLRIGPPGCTANVLIVFSADPNGQAQAIARERSDPASVTGISGGTEGLTAFNAFVNSTQPVRWWRVTRTMTENGEMADRNLRWNESPRVNVPERGRLASPTHTAFSHVIVVVDLNQVNGLRLGALADYISMVALAPVAQNEQREASILNMFADRSAGRQAAEGLTGSDQDYLRGIYR